MLKMEYFNVRLLLGVLRSKQVSGSILYNSVNVRGYISFKLSTRGGPSYPRGRHAPGYPIFFRNWDCYFICNIIVI